jgi:hypothetical protein
MQSIVEGMQQWSSQKSTEFMPGTNASHYQVQTAPSYKAIRNSYHENTIMRGENPKSTFRSTAADTVTVYAPEYFNES